MKNYNNFNDNFISNEDAKYFDQIVTEYKYNDNYKNKDVNDRLISKDYDDSYSNNRNNRLTRNNYSFKGVKELVKINYIQNNNEKIKKSFLNYNSMMPAYWNSLVGIHNERVSCYVNSIVQCLIHLREFDIDFINYYTHRQKDIDKELILELIDIYDDISNSFDLGKSSIKISNFYKFITKNFKTFTYDSQQDALEFLRVLIDNLSMSMKISYFKDVKSNELIKRPNFKCSSDSIKNSSEEFLHWIKLKEYSTIVDLFFGVYVTKYNCMKCGNSINNFQYFLDLPLYIPDNYNNKKEVSVVDLINEQFGKCINDFKWTEECVKCKFISPHIKTEKLTSLSKTVIISIQQNNPYNDCDKVAIKIPNEIDFKVFYEESIVKGLENKCVYELKSVVHHHGRLNNGHYTSNINICDDWYEFDDSLVYKYIEGISYISSSAYILFYTKRL